MDDETEFMSEYVSPFYYLDDDKKLYTYMNDDGSFMINDLFLLGEDEDEDTRIQLRYVYETENMEPEISITSHVPTECMVKMSSGRMMPTRRRMWSTIKPAEKLLTKEEWDRMNDLAISIINEMNAKEGVENGC